MTELIELIGRSKTIGKIKRLISLQEGNYFQISSLSSYEQACIEFFKYFKKDLDFMWEDGWFKRNFKIIRKFWHIAYSFGDGSSFKGSG